jgi:divalent metal cation (Fe/Co/Zn/Cd) transporter
MIAIALNFVLSAAKLVVGHLAHSTDALADGIEKLAIGWRILFPH